MNVANNSVVKALSQLGTRCQKLLLVNSKHHQASKGKDHMKCSVSVKTKLGITPTSTITSSDSWQRTTTRTRLIHKLNKPTASPGITTRNVPEFAKPKTPEMALNEVIVAVL